MTGGESATAAGAGVKSCARLTEPSALSQHWALRSLTARIDLDGLLRHCDRHIRQFNAGHYDPVGVHSVRAQGGAGLPSSPAAA
jgi:hypothetical protein